MTSRTASTGPYQPLLVAIVALLLVAARMPERLAGGFLWAEDGKIFLRDAYALGAASLFKPYAQYLHLLPRLIAYLVSRVCYVDRVARPLAWICALALGAACAYLFAFARRRFSPPTAWAFALAPLLVPHTGEVWLTITNLQWVIAPALLVLLWSAFCVAPVPSPPPYGELRRGAAIVLLTLTGPFGMMFAPLVGARLVLLRGMARSRGAWLAIGAYFLAVAIQLATILANPAPAVPAGAAARPPLAAYLHYPWKGQFLHYLTLDFVLPYSLTDRMGDGWRVAAIAVALLLAACLLLGARSQRFVTVGLFALAAVLWVVGVVRVGMPDLELRWNLGGRYFYVPFVAMAWSLLILRETAPRAGARTLAGLMLALVLVNSVTRFHAAVWQPAGLARAADGSGWLLALPPSADWLLPVRPEWKSP